MIVLAKAEVLAKQIKTYEQCLVSALTRIGEYMVEIKEQGCDACLLQDVITHEQLQCRVITQLLNVFYREAKFEPRLVSSKLDTV